MTNIPGTYTSTFTIAATAANPWTVTSTARLSGTDNLAALYAEGNGTNSRTIFNAGVINPGISRDGILVGTIPSDEVLTAAITNQAGGTISGSFGIHIAAGSGASVANLSGATIASTVNGDYAIVVYGGGSDTVTNAGVISALATNGGGVSLPSNGDIINSATGTITGARGVRLSLGTIVNAGTISGLGGGAIYMLGAGDRLIADPGAVFIGPVKGGIASTGTLELASASSAGTLNASSFTNFSTIDFDTGAAWTLSGATTNLSGTIAGFTLGDTIDLTGFIAVSDVFGSNAVTLTNSAAAQATLHLQGTFSSANLQFAADGSGGTEVFAGSPLPDLLYGQTIDEAGILATSETVASGVLTLFNSGATAVGTIAVGTTLNSSDFTLSPDGASGTDVIVSTIFGTYTSGVTLLTKPTTIASTARLTGSSHPAALYGQGNGTNSQTIINAGVIDGQVIGIVFGGMSGEVASGVITNLAGGTIAGGAGIHIAARTGGGTITNYGVIEGTIGYYGINLQNGGLIANAANGTISGGKGVALHAPGTVINAGTITGTGSDAVYFSRNGGGLLIVDPGAVFAGAVYGGHYGGGSSYPGSTLELASGSSAGTLSATSFTNFVAINFDAGAAWTLQGATTNLSGTVAGFTLGDTIDLTGFVASSDSFGSSAVTLTNSLAAHATLKLLGTFSSANLQFAADGSGGTNVFVVTPHPDLLYGQTIDEAGIVATSETVTAGTLTLFNGVAAVGTIAVGTTLNSSDFTLSPDGASGTDVIVSTVFGTYTTGVTLLTKPTTIASTARLTGSSQPAALYGQGNGTNSQTIINAGVINAQVSGIALGGDSQSGPALVAVGLITNLAGGTIAGRGGIHVFNTTGAGTTITNYGVIEGTISNFYGINLANGGLVVNAASGTISGPTGVAFYAPGTVINAGTISGTGRDAVYFGLLGGGRLIVDPGAVFAGSVYGGRSGGGQYAGSTLELASGSSAGSLSATSFTNFVAIDFDAGAAWTLKGAANNLFGTITGFTLGDTIDLTGFIAVSDVFGSNAVTLTNSAAAQARLHLQGTFSSANLQFAADGSGGTEVFAGSPLPDLLYGQTIDEAGILATSETVTAGIMTLRNSGNAAVGTIAVGTTLNSSDFTLTPDGASGTDVIVSTVFGSYSAGVTLLTNPTTIAGTAVAGNTVSLGTGVLGPAGTAWTVTNLGTITSTTGTGIKFYAGGELINDGTIAAAASSAVNGYTDAVSVTNNGVILSSAASGLRLRAGGTVSNSSTGTISSSTNAIYIAGGSAGTVVNSGTILSAALDTVYVETGTVINAGSIAAFGSHDGIFMAGGGVTNLPNGRISGNIGVYFKSNATATVTNSGTIIGTTRAVSFVGGGSHRLIDTPGAVFSGAIYGGSALATAVIELASAASAGTISGFGTSVTNFGSLVFDPGARWTVAGNAAASGLGTLGIAGFTIGDTIDLSGFVELSDTFAANTLMLGGSGGAHAMLHIQGSFSSGVFEFVPDGAGGTDIVLAPPADLVYGQTIDEAGIVAASETVTAGTMTLFNGINAVSTIAVGTTLNGSDFTLTPDGSGGTDVIVSTVFGTYTTGVTLLTNPTTIAATASASNTVGGTPGLAEPVGTAWTLTNLGTISSVFGVAVEATGVLINHGTVIAGTGNVAIAGYSAVLSVTNTGFVLSAESTAIGEATGGFVSNSSTGTIAGSVGVIIEGAGSVYNSGTILATTNDAVYVASGTVVNTGLLAGGSQGIYAYGGSFTNLLSGTISGNYGVAFGSASSGDKTVSNFGTIIGSGGTAVAFGGSGSGRLIDNPGAVFTGALYGGPSGATAVMELASAASAGTLSGFGTSITNFTSLVFDPGAQWTVAGNDLASGLGTLGISGFNLGDTIDLTGFVAVSDTFAANLLTLTDAGSATETLNIQGLFGGGDFQFAADGSGGTNIFFATPELLYGQTIDEAGVVATSETVSAGVLTLFDSSLTAVGAIVVGTTLGSSDFTLTPDGAGGTDVIVSTVFGTYSSGVTLLANPTTIGSAAQAGNIATNGSGVTGPAGTYWTVSNLGTVTGGPGGTGIALFGGGTVINSSTIVSGYADIGVYGEPGAAMPTTVINNGVILGSGSGGRAVELMSGGYVLNGSAGTLSGDGPAVESSGPAASVVNYGTILATGANIAVTLDTGTVTNQGFIGASLNTAVYLGPDSAVVNESTIDGSLGVVFVGVNDTLYNQGAIIGTGGDGVSLGGGNNRLVLSPGFPPIIGAIYGGGGASVMELAPSDGAGTIAGFGSTVTNFGSIVFDPSATWTVAGNDSASGLGTLAIEGFAVADTIDLTGFVEVSDTFVGNTLILGGPADAQATLNIQGAFSSGDFQFAADGSGGTDIFLAPPSDLVYGQTIDEVGIVATSETVTAGVLTLYDSGNNAVGTIAAGTTLNSSDFSLTPDGAGGTDVIVSTVFGTYSTTVTLLTNPTTIASSGSVIASGSAPNYNGLTGPAGTAWTVSNFGTVAAASSGIGVDLLGGGILTNNGTIVGGYLGSSVYGTGAPLTVTNNGVIQYNQLTGGITLQAGGTIINTGTLLASGEAVVFGSAGGTLINTGTVLATASEAGLISTGTVINSALIEGGGTYAAIISGGGGITNLPGGTISGSVGVSFSAASSGTVTNSGTIIGTDGTAVAFLGTGSYRLIDSPGAVFTGGIYGGPSGATAVMELASAASAGTIAGFGTTITNFTSLVFDPGAQWTVAGNNLPSGLGTLGISGFAVGDTIDLAGFIAVSDTFAAGVLTLTDSGSDTETLNIQGLFGGGDFQFAADGDGGTDIFLAPPDLLYGQTIDEAGIVATSETVTAGVLTLYDSGNNAIGTIAVGTTLNSSDFILAPDGVGGTDLIVSTIFGTYTAGVTLLTNPTTIAANAQAGASVAMETGLYGPSGTFWSLTNFGTISSVAGGTGLSLAAGGSVINDGTISGATAIAGSDGPLTLTNYGLILAYNNAAVQGEGGGVVTNYATIMASSGDGIYLIGGGTLTNFAAGTISALYGVVLGAAGTLDNLGAILGGASFQTAGYLTNAASGRISALTEAVSMASTGTVVNAGTITASSESGTGVDLPGGGTLINSGVISGGAFSVYLGGSGGNLLVDDPGATFNGLAAGGTLAASALELASAASAGTISGVGSSFTNFAQVTVDSGAAWTFSGQNTQASATTLVNNGTILVASSLQEAGVALNDGTISVDGTMYAGQLLGTGRVILAAPGLDLAVGGTFAAGQTVVLAGNNQGISLGNTAAAAGTISGFSSSDAIYLPNLPYNGADQTALLAGNVLQVTKSDTTTFDLQLNPSDSFTGFVFNLEASGDGSEIGLADPVTAVTAAPATADLGLGAAVTLTLTMDSAVTVTGGPPTLTLNDGGTATFDPGASTPTALVFNYTVMAGQDTADLAVTGVALDGASITDADGQPADLSGAVANPVGILQIDTVIPPVPAGLALASASDSGVPGDGITNVTTPMITGTGVNGDTVTLYDTDGTTVLGSATVAGGVWSITLATALAAGSHTLTATQTDIAGNVSGASAALPLTIDITVPPAPAALTLAAASDSGVPGDDITNVTTPMITGTGINGDIVTLYDTDGTTVLGTATLAAGVWSVTLATPLAAGSHTLTATQTDIAGNVSGASAALPLTIDTTVPPAPAALTLAAASDSGVPGDDITNVTTPMITGTGINGDIVTLYDTDGTTVLGTATVTSGVWSITTTALAAGGHSLTATQTDVAGNTSTGSNALPLVIDTTIPPAPAALTLAPASDSGAAGDDITNVTTPAITGTGIAGDIVTLYDGDTPVGTATVATDGTWSVTASSLSAGPHTLTATQTDVAGNTSYASSVLLLTIDTTIPAAPTELTLAPASDSGVQGDDITSVALPTFTGTGPADSLISLYDGAIRIGTATAGSNGAWSVLAGIALNEGVNSLTATATDVAGNVSASSEPLSVTLDTTAPAAPTLGESVAATNPAEPAIDGTAESGSLVTLYQNGSMIATATAASGSWDYDYPAVLAAGTYTLNATATDSAGNVSALSANLILQVNADDSYAVVKPVAGTTDTQSFIYSTQGVLNTVQTQNAQQQVLTTVNNTAVLINIYDTAGTLIGTITQPSASPFTQPVFATTPNTLAASTGSSASVPSMVNLLSETNNFVSQGNDDITVQSGTAVITATGPSTVVNNVSANVTFFGGPGTATVNGGSGSVTAVGGAGGGTLTGGTAGNNVLVANGGVTTVVGGGNGDLLFGAATGTDTLVAGPGVETLIAGAATATLTANTGDTAFGGSGNSTLNAGANGGSTLVGGSGTQTLNAAAGPVSMWAGSGNSTLQGGSGDDVMGGSTAINSTTLMLGGTGDATFLGSAGSTTATGGSGNDTYWTSTGAMTITEGSGNDTVVFGSGTANVTGGTGDDIYSFISGYAGGADMINDFKVGLDYINLFGYAANAVQQQVSNGNTVFNLADNTSIVLVGVTKLAVDSVRYS